MEDGIVESLEPATWGSVTGKPSTFTPAAHTHTIANVTGLQAIIDDLTARIESFEAAE